ncbi:MAG: sulfite exporter TauE/SafE family protein [Lachnospiraceae bacterium]|nr:sulfite exporter TauE/SafE family protein [Lachnospiraceae bacterium]
MTLLFAAVAFIACLIGKLCGMGGGVLIKPVLDASGLLQVAAINFLSGCTVIGMSLWSVGKSVLKKDARLDLRISTPLAMGAACGGLLGKELFRLAAASFSDENKAGTLQALLLFVATFCTLLYTLKKDSLRSYHVKSPLPCVCIGLFLGTIGAFLGIGGGPFNMAVLFLFFSMPVKTAAENSLYIILISQTVAILFTLATSGMPQIAPVLLLALIISGILGSELGSRIAVRIDEKRTTALFLVTMVLVMLICVYNFLRFLHS